MRIRSLLAVSLLAALLSVMMVLAQEEPSETDRASPATGHEQVIAQGVAAMPEEMIGWQIDVNHALLPERASAAKRPAGFILATGGVVGLTDADGTLLARLAPGEGVWRGEKEEWAIVSLERGPVDYYEILLLPAPRLTSDGQANAAGEPFAAPEGETFDVDLIRDVLARDEESPVSTGEIPALLLVTRGAVFVTSADGAVAELGAGDAMAITSDPVVTGGSRGPAAFVVARIDAAVSESIELSDESATPRATPVSGFDLNPARDASASISVSAFTCPVAYEGTSFTIDCPDAAEDVRFALKGEDGTVLSDVVSPAGEVSFVDVAPGDYTFAADVPRDVASSRASCLNRSTEEMSEEMARNRTTLSLDADDPVVCVWFIVPEGEISAAPAAEPDLEELDSDGDGLTEAREEELGTDPLLADSDEDGLSDRDEIDVYGTDPLRRDSDRDGLEDAEELLDYTTNPLLGDTDGDGIPDEEEFVSGSDPLDLESVPATPTPPPTSTQEATATPTPTPEGTPASGPDSERDATPLPAPRSDLDDLDGDGVTDCEEVTAGTDPLDRG